MKLPRINFHELAMNRIRPYQVQINLAKWWTLTNNPELNDKTNQVHNDSPQFVKQSLINVHEQAMNRTKTYQVHNNSSKWWTLTNNHELNNETNQVHNNSPQFMKQSLINFHD